MSAVESRIVFKISMCYATICGFFKILNALINFHLAIMGNIYWPFKVFNYYESQVNHDIRLTLVYNILAYITYTGTSNSNCSVSK